MKGSKKMKKRIFAALLVVCLLAGMTVVPVSAAGKTIDAYCEHCKEPKTWMALESASDSITGTEYDHYFMAATSGNITFGAKTVTGTVCLDVDNQEYVGNRRLIVASGGVSGIEDIAAIKKCGAAGAIIGKAFYAGTIDLAAAVKLAAEQ